LGYNGITPSAALELNIYTGDHGGEGYQFGTDGATPDSDAALGNFQSCAPVNLASGHPILVRFYYDQNVAHLLMVDATAGATFATTLDVPDLTSVVGPSAFVGFTGGTGGLNAIQTVSNFVFSYTTPPILSVTHPAPDSVVVSWPVSVSTLFVLQAANSLEGPWENVGTAPVIVNSENEVTVVPGTATFYRLVIP
jgi:hypothetical protein